MKPAHKEISEHLIFMAALVIVAKIWIIPDVHRQIYIYIYNEALIIHKEDEVMSLVEK